MNNWTIDDSAFDEKFSVGLFRSSLCGEAKQFDILVQT